MKKISLKAISGIALAVFLVLAAIQVPTYGQNGKGKRIEGTWRVQITARNCQTGAELRTFRGMNTFVAGGSVIQDGAATSPALASTGHGVWEHTGGRSFLATVEFFLFAPDGSFAGIQRLTRNIELSSSSDEFTSNDSFEIIAPNGDVVATGCATTIGQRFE